MSAASRGKRRALSTTCGTAAIRTARGGATEPGEGFMSMLLNSVKLFVRDEEGQDLLEYALLVALIALIAIGAVGAAGTSVKGIFTSIANQLTSAT
jgi:pilus assembly protein Flp/PilA